LSYVREIRFVSVYLVRLGNVTVKFGDLEGNFRNDALNDTASEISLSLGAIAKTARQTSRKKRRGRISGRARSLERSIGARMARRIEKGRSAKRGAIEIVGCKLSRERVSTVTRWGKRGTEAKRLTRVSAGRPIDHLTRVPPPPPLLSPRLFAA